MTHCFPILTESGCSSMVTVHPGLTPWLNAFGLTNGTSRESGILPTGNWEEVLDLREINRWLILARMYVLRSEEAIPEGLRIALTPPLWRASKRSGTYKTRTKDE